MYLLNYKILLIYFFILPQLFHSIWCKPSFYTDSDETWLSEEGQETSNECAVDFEFNMKSEWTLTASPVTRYLMLFGR